MSCYAGRYLIIKYLLSSTTQLLHWVIEWLALSVNTERYFGVESPIYCKPNITLEALAKLISPRFLVRAIKEIDSRIDVITDIDSAT
ncbi:MAG: hypothetical protein V7L14_15020 [Nostoc sp.]|uniref:hypothetical protein n=1 Tax=unclassified Nostoc TaxID=2593658 RepID=UPI0025F08268|nr:hypothetical protein [Nostoc sp. NOS(2021)]MBN3899059.1 hypothetical protein [Nostoc sp. NOS(2021)]